MPGLEDSASHATGSLATGGAGKGTAAGVPTQTVQTAPTLMARNTTQSQAMHPAVAPALSGADEQAANQPMASLSSAEANWAASRHEPSTAQSAGTKESLFRQAVANSSTGNVSYPSTAASVAPAAPALAVVSSADQTSPDSVQEPSKQLTDRVTSRAANRDAMQESSASAPQVSAAQPAGLDAAVSSAVRIPGAPQISTPSASFDRPVAAAVAAAATTQDSFSALDAGSLPGTPAWTYAGSQHAEAGFRDPALGWVSVRADLNGGGIHATLVPSSPEAAQALNGHLAGLSTHLVEQQSPVTSVTMSSPSGNGVENGMSQRMQQGAEGNPQRNAPDEAQAGAQENAPSAASTSVLATPAQTSMRDSLAHPGDSRGTYISVMA